ncbi:MAG: FAD-dependent oxidoreductase [Chloroflexota bacterium]
MSENPGFQHLLTPLQLGPKMTRNRVLISGHQPTMARDGKPTDQYIAYQQARARGGAGLQITGATGVHHTGMYTADHGALINIDDSIILGYQRLATAVHAEGGLMLAQLAHAGAVTHSVGAGSPLWAPSPVAADLVQEVPHEMTVAEIEEVVAAFGEAARRVREGGLDGIEILAAFGLLISAFLSPQANQREDDYGGWLDNRLRFCLEVIDAVRANAGPDLIVGIRIPGDEMVKGGLELAEMQQVAQRLEATGKLDYFNVIAGTNLDRIQRISHWAPTPSKFGRFVHLASAIKQVVSLPVFTVGRVVDPRHAEEILAAGYADMVGMTRAHVADSQLVSKVRNGRLADIRPCVGANVCISLAMTGKPITCIHNAETGRESTWTRLEPPAEPRRVLVVGGGPAGLEAVRVAAERGHRVTLYERQQELGGQLRLWASVPTMREFQQIIDWRVAQLEKLDVTVVLGEGITAVHPAVEAADVVILATGSRPHEISLPRYNGATMPILTPHKVIEERGKQPLRQAQGQPFSHALVWDEGGGQTAVAAAEALIAQGSQITLVTSAIAVAEDVTITVRTPLYQRLFAAGANFIPNHKAVALDGDDVVLANVFSQAEQRVSGVDLVVSWQGNRVVESLAASLRERNITTHTIGDCVSPRTVQLAMAEAAIVARQI